MGEAREKSRFMYLNFYGQKVDIPYIIWRIDGADQNILIDAGCSAEDYYRVVKEGSEEGFIADGTELGQESTAMLAQIAAEELGLKINKVFVEMGDTWNCPRVGRTSASRLTYALGNALLLATEKIRETLIQRAAKMLGINKDKLTLVDGEIKVKGSSSKKLSLQKIAEVCSNEGLKLLEESWFKFPEDRYMYGHTFMASAADVEVDLITGEIKILKLINVHDSGKVINPDMANGQLYGGSIQALGYALKED